MNTTFFINNQIKPYNKSEKCHGGVGPFLFRGLTEGAPNNLALRFVHDDIIPPGSTFGLHTHHDGDDAEEWYICLSGEGTMTNDGQDHPFRPGDAAVCYENGTHGVRNTGKEDLRILVLNINPGLAKKHATSFVRASEKQESF